MTQTELLLVNFEEVRRRSIMLWKALPKEHYFWKPDPEAENAMQMIRHVLVSDGWFRVIITASGDVGKFDSSFWEDAPRRYKSLDDDRKFSKPYRERYLQLI